MSEDQFTKLFKYIEEFHADVDKRFTDLDSDVADLKGALGELSAQVRDYHNKMMIGFHQFDKLKEAILQIAQETGVKLKVEL
jgi:hypothetical protein